MTMTQGSGVAARTAAGEHPIQALTRRREQAEAMAAQLDAWTRNPANSPADGDDFAEAEWEYKYQRMRRERRRVRRLTVGILRMQIWLYGEDANTRAALTRLGR